MDLNRIRAVVFDFDGTLAVLNIDFSSMKERVFELVGRFGVDGGLIREKYLLEVIDEVHQLLLQGHIPDAQEFLLEAQRVLHRVEMEAADRGELLPGAKRTLKSLRAKGMKLGIVTRNCEEAVRKVFPEIDDFCNVFISRDSIAKVKPHPEHLAAVLRALEVSGEEALMIGDHIIDIQAGKGAGMRTAGVLTGRTRQEEFEKAGADHVLTDVSEACGLLGLLIDHC